MGIRLMHCSPKNMGRVPLPVHSQLRVRGQALSKGHFRQSKLHESRKPQILTWGSMNIISGRSNFRTPDSAWNTGWPGPLVHLIIPFNIFKTRHAMSFVSSIIRLPEKHPYIPWWSHGACLLYFGKRGLRANGIYCFSTDGLLILFRHRVMSCSTAGASNRHEEAKVLQTSDASQLPSLHLHKHAQRDPTQQLQICTAQHHTQLSNMRNSQLCNFTNTRKATIPT